MFLVKYCLLVLQFIRVVNTETSVNRHVFTLWWRLAAVCLSIWSSCCRFDKPDYKLNSIIKVSIVPFSAICNLQVCQEAVSASRMWCLPLGRKVAHSNRGGGLWLWPSEFCWFIHWPLMITVPSMKWVIKHRSIHLTTIVPMWSWFTQGFRSWHARVFWDFIKWNDFLHRNSVQYNYGDGFAKYVKIKSKKSLHEKYRKMNIIHKNMKLWILINRTWQVAILFKLLPACITSCKLKLCKSWLQYMCVLLM